MGPCVWDAAAFLHQNKMETTRKRPATCGPPPSGGDDGTTTTRVAERPCFGGIVDDADVCAEIAQFLGFQDRCRLSSTCRELATSPVRREFVESIVVTLPRSHGGTNHSPAAILARHSGRFVQKLSIPTVACARFLECCENVRAVTIATAPARFGCQLDAFPNLERLEITNEHLGTRTMSVRSLFCLRALTWGANTTVESLAFVAGMPALECLVLGQPGTHCDVRDLACLRPTLRELRFVSYHVAG